MSGRNRSLTRVVEVTPTLDTNIYADGDRMGSIFEIPNAVAVDKGHALWVSLVALDKDGQSKAFDVYLFNDKPTIASADNAAIDIIDTEMEKFIGMFSIEESDYGSLAANSVGFQKDFAIPIHNNVSKIQTGTGGLSQRSVWGVLISRGAPTHSTAGLVLKFGLIQD